MFQMFLFAGEGGRVLVLVQGSFLPVPPSHSAGITIQCCARVRMCVWAYMGGWGEECDPDPISILLVVVFP